MKKVKLRKKGEKKESDASKDFTDTVRKIKKILYRPPTRTTRR